MTIQLLPEKKYENRLRQSLYNLSESVLTFTEQLPDSNGLSVVRDQLLKSISLVGVRIVEVQSAASADEVVRVCESALQNTKEIKYWLSFLQDSDLLQTTDYLQRLLRATDEFSNLLAASVINANSVRRI